MTRHFAANILTRDSLGSAIRAGFPFSTNVNEILKDQFEEIMRFYLLNYILPSYFSAADKRDSFNIKSDHTRKNFITHLLDFIPLNFLDYPTEKQDEFIAAFAKIFNESIKKKALEDDACPTCVEENKTINAKTVPVISDFFTRKHLINDSTKELFQIDEEKLHRALNTANDYDFMMNYLDRDKLTPDVKVLQATIKEYCEKLAKQFHESKPEQLLPFYRIIYVLEDNEKLQNINNIYTSKSELRLGEDIKTIAVDDANILPVIKLCSKNNIQNLKVVTIASLKQVPHSQLFNNKNCLANPIIHKIKDPEYPKLLISNTTCQ